MYSRSPSTERIDTARLRQAHPITDVIDQYGIELRRSGSAFVGRCPFHTDAGRPNLTVYPRSARFVCFRCHARGDVIAFVQQLEQLSFRDAVGRLSERGTAAAKVCVRRSALPRLSPTPRTLASCRGPEHMAVLSAAVELYAYRLLSDSVALEYLALRGFGPALAEQSRLGYARGGDLLPYLIWRGHSPHVARQLGLVHSNGREVFAGRVIVPELRDGRPVWIIGRLIDPGQLGPKYLGLAGAKPLLGWDDAKRDLSAICLVEGPLDLLALRQWEIRGLALCGTAVSPRILALLKQWHYVYVALDSDAAGQEGLAHLTAALGPCAIPVTLPRGAKDPAELALLPQGVLSFRGHWNSRVVARE